MYTENRPLRDRIREKGVLVAAHRGTRGGNVIQNTCLACRNALLHGADVVEMDAAMTRDGVFYAFHDGEEPLVCGVSENIRTMSAAQADALTVFNSLGLPVRQKLERLEQVFDALRGTCLINVDRAWFYWPEIIGRIHDCGMERQVILKSPPEPAYLRQLEQTGEGIMYMPILKSVKEWERVREFDVNVAAAELIFADLDSPLVSEAFLGELRREGIAPWVNAITLDDDTVLSGGLDDNRAIGEGFEAAWGELVRMGFEMIQTDWPALLRGYLDGGRCSRS